MTERSVSYRFVAKFDSFKSQVAAAQRSVNGFADDLTKLDKRGETMRRGLTELGNGAGKMGLIAAGGLAASAKAAIDWETAWAGVTKTVDGSSTQLQQLEDDLREMARTLPASHQEIAAVAEAAGQLGVQTESVAEFTETMIALGETTNLTAEEAATSIARFTNIMGTSAGEVENIGSALVDLGNNSATTEAEILTLGTRLAAAGSIAGLSESDVLAFASTLTSVGVEAEAGGTALSKVFTTMRDAVIDGGDKLDTFASTAGVTASEFQQQWGDNPASAVNAFIQGLGEMNAAGESTSSVFDALSLTDQRLMRALLSTAESGDLLTESLTRGSDAYVENGALAEEFGKRQETTGAQVAVAWNNIRDAAIEAGDVLLPIIAEGAEGAAALASAFGRLPEPVQNTVVALGGLVAIFGGGLWFTSRVINGVASMKGALADLGIQADGTRASLAQTAAAGTAFATVAASIPSLISDYDTWQRGRDALDATAGSLEDLTEILSESNLGKYAGDLGINVQRLAQDLHMNGENGEYATRVLDELAASTDGFGDRAKAAAGDWLPFWTGEANKAWDAQQDLGNILDTNADLLGAGADAAAGNATAHSALEEALLGADSATESLTGAIEDYVGANLAAFGATTAWREALVNAREQANGNRAGIQGLSDAALQNRGALDQLAQAWAKQVEAGNATEQTLKRARRQFIDTAVAMGVGRDRARELADQLLSVPKNVQTTVSQLGMANSLRDIASYKASLAGVPRTIRTTLITEYRRDSARVNQQGANIGGSPIERADGGTVPGFRFPYGDKVSARLAPGEFVVSNRYGQADRHHELLSAINANRYADGGTVGRTAPVPVGTGGSGGTVIHRVEVKVTGDMDLNRAKAQIHQVAESVSRTVSRQEIDADAAWQQAQGYR
ncbi:phage tail tape measure protein [Nocardioides panacisoli]|uniref:phage tail tape measure protein n=1 Tax=Nocardioides panacisoli TaxID=627624 RepID=UPI001C62E010|nr:phage tail tape measure protein [Nocardioides panacisoli]QYJ05379.1 phage tail tape measure protein [Nocardioides panacisoli]